MPSLPFHRAAALTFAGILAFWATIPSAWAHAVIIDSTPAVGAVLAAADSDIALRFNSRIDHQRSRLTLVPADGKARPLAITQDTAPDIVAAKLSNLAPGQYRLRWQVLAVDGHLTRGDIPFSVKAP
jgi:methionine-rich copper-binding protein CopC